jgi:hypothetical protein
VDRSLLISQQIKRGFKWSLVTRIRYQNPDAKRPIVMSGVRARQGVTGHNVRYVLGFGLAGAITALTLLYLFYFSVDW